MSDEQNMEACWRTVGTLHSRIVLYTSTMYSQHLDKQQVKNKYTSFVCPEDSGRYQGTPPLDSACWVTATSVQQGHMREDESGA